MENLKKRLKKETLFGTFVPFALGDVADYTSRLGFDFIIIDNEHGIMNQETIFDMIRAAQCQRTPVLVRCTNSTPDMIHKVLDMGAEGILVPVINTAEDAREVIKSAFYPPKGERGIAYFTRASSYGLIEDKTEFLKKANEEVFISIQLETGAAIENLDEILEVEGIDMFFIGPNDLAASLGIPNSHPEMERIIEETISKIIAKGKTAGIFVTDDETARKYTGYGTKFILTSITKYLTQGVKEYLRKAKNN
ncbi:aldolase/citrate lyase family protein [uncultured Fusobacterium sp.]|uniref:HpcH/HpaI aldolase family protein n=1 Tax=uncultured Fusobacterium sp. TaxID=159267 RepID=UPI0025F3F4BC|nr:aldolase/citrate lyase family protein [uncultured Fusobacterium sp.]